MHAVEETMSADVVTVLPDASVTVAARIMRDAGVSGLPVVDSDGCVVGILTEADLLHRAIIEGPGERAVSRLSRDRRAGSTVAELMSRDVIGVRRDDSLATAARLMETARVRRLVVVGDGLALEGIISRSDVIAPLARSDADIEAEIRSCVVTEILGLDPDDVTISVNQGIAIISGVVAERREADRLERLASKVLGVSRVDSAVTWRTHTTSPWRTPRFA